MEYYIDTPSFEFLDNFSFHVLSVEDGINEAILRVSRVVRRVFDSGAPTNPVSSLLPGDETRGEK